MTVRVATSIDVVNPPVGHRLELATTAAALGVSFSDMETAVGVSRSALFSIASENRWPKTKDSQQIRTALTALMKERGATPRQLETLFHAHVRRTRIPAHQRTSDNYGRAKEAPVDQPEAQDMLLAKQTLSMEARKAFSLFTNPFDGEVTSSAEMFQNGEVRFVREACWQAAIGGRFVAVVGESGAGKTTLLADLKERITTDRKPAIVIEPSVLGMEDSRAGMPLKSNDILTAIVLTIDPLAKVAITMERRSRQAEQALAASTTAGNNHLLLIEEAHSLPIATLKHLKRLHERMRLNGRKPMLGILLLGQPELKVKLDEKRHDVREVVQRIEMVDLRPLDGDLKAYLTFRAKSVDRELGQLIDDSGIEEIRARLTVLRPGVRNAPVSLLYPLAVNNLVTACLNTAAELGAPIVDRDVVRAV